MLRVLLDGGSDASYIRSSIAEEMGLSVIGSGTFACIGFQERAEEPRIYNQVQVSLRNRHGGESHEFELGSFHDKSTGAQHGTISKFDNTSSMG